MYSDISDCVNSIGGGHSHYGPMSAGEKNHSCGWYAISEGFHPLQHVIPSSVMAAHSLHRMSIKVIV